MGQRVLKTLTCTRWTERRQGWVSKYSCCCYGRNNDCVEWGWEVAEESFYSTG